MDVLLKAIETAPVASALRSSLYAYPLVSALHIAAFGVLLTSLMFLHGRTFGWFPSLEARAIERTFRRSAFAAFVVAVLTGLALFSVRATEYTANPAFQAKMALLGLAALNLCLWIALPGWRRATSAVSVLLWICILLAGRFIGFV